MKKPGLSYHKLISKITALYYYIYIYMKINRVVYLLF